MSPPAFLAGDLLQNGSSQPRVGGAASAEPESRAQPAGLLASTPRPMRGLRHGLECVVEARGQVSRDKPFVPTAELWAPDMFGQCVPTVSDGVPVTGRMVGVKRGTRVYLDGDGVWSTAKQGALLQGPILSLLGISQPSELARPPCVRDWTRDPQSGGSARPRLSWLPA